MIEDYLSKNERKTTRKEKKQCVRWVVANHEIDGIHITWIERRLLTLFVFGKISREEYDNFWGLRSIENDPHANDLLVRIKRMPELRREWREQKRTKT